MDFAVTLPTSGPRASPAAIVRLACEAEQLGYSAVWTHERLLYSLGDIAQPGGPPADFPTITGRPMSRLKRSPCGRQGHDDQTGYQRARGLVPRSCGARPPPRHTRSVQRQGGYRRSWVRMDQARVRRSQSTGQAPRHRVRRVYRGNARGMGQGPGCVRRPFLSHSAR